MKSAVKDFDYASGISGRLARVRLESGMNIRDFAARITEVGYPVSYGSVNTYERAETAGKIPAAYLAAVAREFGKSAAWMLFGEGPEDDRPPERAALALAIIESVVEASGDDEAFHRFWGYWQAFKTLSSADAESGASARDPAG